MQWQTRLPVGGEKCPPFTSKLELIDFPEESHQYFKSIDQSIEDHSNSEAGELLQGEKVAILGAGPSGLMVAKRSSPSV